MIFSTPRKGSLIFRDRCNIPRDVQVRAPRPDESLEVGSRDGMPFPTIAIVERGVRFPLDPLILFLSLANLFPLQCAPNLFRIVMGVAALNRSLGTSLEVFDILSCYYLIPLNNRKSIYYLKSRDLSKFLFIISQIQTNPVKGILLFWAETGRHLPSGVGSIEKFLDPRALSFFHPPSFIY